MRDNFAIRSFFGVLTRISAILFIIEMIGATLTAKLSKGFVSGYDFDLLLVAVSISPPPAKGTILDN